MDTRWMNGQMGFKLMGNTSLMDEEIDIHLFKFIFQVFVLLELSARPESVLVRHFRSIFSSHLISEIFTINRCLLKVDLSCDSCTHRYLPYNTFYAQKSSIECTSAPKIPQINIVMYSPSLTSRSSTFAESIARTVAVS